MQARTKAQQADLSDCRRWIHSLASLLHAFGFSFVREPKCKSLSEVAEECRAVESCEPGFNLLSAIAKARQRELAEACPNKVKARVAACQRFDHGCVSDADVEYWITDFDPRAVEAIGGFNLTKGLGAALENLSHGATCGCGGCYDRIQSSWEIYQTMLTN